MEDNEALTKTGRISRALKGKPVHKCDVCDKVSTKSPTQSIFGGSCVNRSQVYTRNEHLR